MTKISKKQEQLINACMNNDVKEAKKAIKKGANINETLFMPNNSQFSPLSIGVYNGSTDIIEYLIENGANVNWTNQEGQTLIDKAIVSAAGTEIVQILHSAGAIATTSLIDMWIENGILS